MYKIILLVVFYFTFPLVIIYFCQKWSVLQKLGTIVFAYGFGLLLGSSGIFPEGSTQFKLALQGRTCLPGPEIENLILKSWNVLP